MLLLVRHEKYLPKSQVHTENAEQHISFVSPSLKLSTKNLALSVYVLELDEQKKVKISPFSFQLVNVLLA